ncbi:MAG TPA: 2OG-Fe(II) oxygenase [Xanthobacteraceae bacterium]|nr:2OG-Fe(II) oxygenase [Xanthobacteraceae bacterium]
MSFFRTVTVNAAGAGRSPHLLTRLRQREIEGILVKEVYDRRACEAVRAELEAGHHGLIRTDFPAKFAAFFYGINLNLAHPDLNDYFAEVPKFRDGLSRLLPGDLGLESRLTRLMSDLDRDTGYGAAPGPQPGLNYMFTTIRAHLPGGYIPAHFDDEQAARPTYRHLMQIIQMKLFSFVLAFSQAEAGGALEIFNLKPEKEGQRIAAGDRSATKRDLDGVEKVSFRLDPGDMIIFSSGHYLHRVTPVSGEKIRWTACSFMAESKAPGQVYCWG